MKVGNIMYCKKLEIIKKLLLKNKKEIYLYYNLELNNNFINKRMIMLYEELVTNNNYCLKKLDFENTLMFVIKNELNLVNNY